MNYMYINFECDQTRFGWKLSDESMLLENQLCSLLSDLFSCTKSSCLSNGCIKSSGM